MINMPLTCNIQSNYATKTAVSLLTSGVDKPVEDTLSIFPNNLAKVVEVTWLNLKYSELIELEYWLMKSKATERFLWGALSYLLEDGYTVEVQANRPIVKANFRRVG
mgnify:CR=1 FL=1